MGTLCKASLFLLLLAFAACGCGKAQPSCNSAPGGMSCRALLDIDGETIHMEAVNITVPSQIAVPSGSKLIGVLQAVGHQHYRYNGTAWVLYNATAWLHEGEEEGANMSLISGGVKGTHFYLAEEDSNGGRPSWRVGSSRITAKSLAAVSVDSDSITWNLLQATSYELIVSGKDVYSITSWAEVVGEVRFVQRLDTQRGLPPAASASPAHSSGDTFASVYSARYAFYI